MIWTSHARKGSNTPVGIPESTFLMSPPSTSTSRTCSVWLPPTTRETPRHHNQPRCRSGLLMLAGSDREFDNFDIPFIYRVLVVITDWNPIFQLHYNITHCWYLNHLVKRNEKQEAYWAGDPGIKILNDDNHLVFNAEQALVYLYMVQT